MATEADIVTSECTHVNKVSPEIHARAKQMETVVQ